PGAGALQRRAGAGSGGVVKGLMARRKPLPEPPPVVPQRRLRRWLLQFLAVLFVGGALLAGLAWLVHGLREWIHDSDRYQVALADIDCNPPPPLTRTEFVDEVQYLSGIPDHLSLVDDGLEEKLRLAFAKHPWVRSVRVALKPPGGVSL